MKVLFVGTEPKTTDKVSMAVRLRWPDARVLVASVEATALDVVELEDPELVVYQPSQDGLPMEGFIEALRKFSDVSLMVLEQEEGGGEMVEVKALESGADDYLHQTAGIIELVARMMAMIRRISRTERGSGDSRITSGSLILDPASYEVFLHDTRLTLTATEFRLLHLLLKNRRNVVSHQLLASALWGDQVDSSALVKKYIQRLRRKLGDTPQDSKWIATIHGVGYRFLGPGVEEQKKTVAVG